MARLESPIEGQTTPIIPQGQVSAEGIWHLVNINLGSNSGMRIFEPRILGLRWLDLRESIRKFARIA